MQSVISSNIAAVGYDSQARTLTVQFHNGRTYDYFGVPESVYLGLITASSHGRYFNVFVKGNYAYRRVAWR